GEVYVSQGNKAQWEPFVVTSEPLTFNVLDLRRRADRPPDFTGAVGSLHVTAQASQTRMPPRTAFTLTVRLDGNGAIASDAAADRLGRRAAGPGRRRPGRPGRGTTSAARRGR